MNRTTNQKHDLSVKSEKICTIVQKNSIYYTPVVLYAAWLSVTPYWPGILARFIGGIPVIPLGTIIGRFMAGFGGMGLGAMLGTMTGRDNIWGPRPGLIPSNNRLKIHQHQ